MRKFFSHFVVFVIFFILSNTFVFARSGCCSHHRGVCGCSCCDGSSLSSTCAPYYPECNSRGGVSIPTNTPIPWPTWTPIPTYTSTPTYTPTPTLTNTPTPTPTNMPSLIPTISITPKPTKKILPKQISKSKQQTIKKKTFWQWLFNR